MSDFEDQTDEICVLESIYTAEELQIEKDKDGKISGKFFAFISVPANFHISYQMLELDKPPEETPANVIPLSHLPPINLTFKLPIDYPSKSMPQYHLSCSWLKYTWLKRLSQKLESLWTENNGMVVLYIWTRFLKEEALSLLHIGEKLDVTGFYVKTLKIINKKVPICTDASPSNKDHPLCRRMSARISGTSSTNPKFSLIHIPNMHLHQFLQAYSDDRSKTEFQRGVYSCDICFTEKVGAKCIQFIPCDHVYCKDCLKSFFEVRIKEGSIHTMPCPYMKCTSEALQSQIRECVGPILFAKYDKQLLSATLDKMQDITYCPRTVCGCPVMRETDEKIAVCPSCNHVFCVFCKMTYHGVEPCRLKTEEKLNLVKEYENGDENTKLTLEKRYGKKQIAMIMEDVKSESWISSNSKPCPNCNVAIEKNDGCNKMSCWKCNTYFCWLCLVVLDMASPYIHYNDPTSRCHARLFEGTLLFMDLAAIDVEEEEEYHFDDFDDDDEDEDDDDEDDDDEDDENEIDYS